MRSAAEDEMVLGFLEGYDINEPEPGPNRSKAYRHGFANGRDDILNSPRADATTLQRVAEEILGEAKNEGNH